MERGMNERIRKLRRQSVTVQPAISMERAVLVTEAYQKYAGIVDPPILRALTFKHIMENKTLCINDGELIVGEKGEGPQCAPTYPELCCHTLDDFEIISSREKISFRVSEEARRIQAEKIIPFWRDRSLREIIFSHMSPQWKDCYASGIFTEFMEQRAPGHTVADGKIYRKGFLDFKEDIQEALDRLDFFNDDQAYEKKIQLEAMKICCDAIIAYGQRYARYARELAGREADPGRRAELLAIAANCERVPAHRPETFAQAIQMYWFVHIGVTSELNNWDAFSPGRLDQHLYPFYIKGIEDGTLTEEKARELLACLWIKFNNQPAPPKVGVTLKESATYTDFANINSGGVKADGSDGVNDVTYLILDTMDEMRLLQPSSNVQISRKSPHRFVRRACEIARQGWGQPAMYNTDAIIQELLRAGKDITDAREGGASGCVETGAFGKEAYILTGYFNLPKVLEITLNNGFDKFTGKQPGLQTGYATDFKSYEDLFAAFTRQLKHFVDIKIKGNNVIEKIYATRMPCPFLSTVISDCIEKGMDYNAGGARYNTSYIQGVGIGTLADCLSSIKYNVFDKKRISMEELMRALDANFEGYDHIRHLVINKTPKYGNDEDYADRLMLDAFNAFYNAVNGRKNMKGGTYRIDMLPTTCHVYFGSVMGASPNGRLAGKPLSEGISPHQGADRRGPTAVIKSAAKMDHLRTGGTLLNQKFSPSVTAGDEGLENLVSLVRTYFNLDGHHIQFNVVDRRTLIAAQQRPEEYRDLIVRVAGYSDYFHNLNRDLQDEIIARTEQTFDQSRP
ncbi:MAG: glycyl radical protein [Peptococcaceae bacterium]|nr:glycyl radical protein [Peptococcaceae bacterium]